MLCNLRVKRQAGVNMAPRRVKINKLDYNKLTANDVVCPLCRSILIKPITLPCNHGFCSVCFEPTARNSNVVCPLCRVRVGSWLRTATKSNKLINETFWKAIQELFPLQVKNKLRGINVSEGKCDNKNKGKVLTMVSFDKTKDEKVDSDKGSVPSTSNKTCVKNETLLLGKERAQFFLNNFATKEYTCRILCQNVGSKETKSETQMNQNLVMKNKRIQKITEQASHDRSNSIESECLYFKPIDYRHNPPSEGLAPIKVPTRKPNISPHAKIIAPSGQNQISMNNLQSAFARLCAQESQMSPDEEDASLKRKNGKTENKAKKKIKKIDNESIEVTNVCDKNQCKMNNSKNSARKINHKQSRKSLSDENLKRLQEQMDYELAKKLQQCYNRCLKYSTRSAVLKKTGNQVKMKGIMT